MPRTHLLLLTSLLLAPLVPAQVAPAADVRDGPAGPLLLRAQRTTAHEPLAGSAGGGTLLPLREGIEGDAPLSLAVTSDGATAVVACRDSDALELWDTTTGRRLAGVAVAERPVHVTLTSDGTRALVACHAAGTVDVVDLATRALVHRIAIGDRPYRVATLSDGVHAVVGIDHDEVSGRIAIVDVVTGQVVSIFVTVSQFPTLSLVTPSIAAEFELFPDFAVTPDDSLLVLPYTATSTIHVYDLASGSQVQSFSVPNTQPWKVDIARSGALAAVGCPDVFTGLGRVVLLDLATMQASDLDVGADLYLGGLRITPDETAILATRLGGLDVIDIASGAVTSVEAGGPYGAIEFTHDDAFALAGSFETTVIDLATYTPVAKLATGLLSDVAIDPTSQRAFGIGPFTDENLRAFTTYGASSRVSWIEPLGVPAELDAPTTLALTRDERRALVACPVSHNLAYVDLDAPAVLSILPTDGPSRALDVSPVEPLAVAALADSSQIAILDIAAGQTLVELGVTGLPAQVWVSRDGARAYSRSSLVTDGVLTRIDLAGGGSTVAAELVVPDALWLHASPSPDGSTIALTSPTTGLSLVDTATLSVVKTFPKGTNARDVGWSADGQAVAWWTSTGGVSVARDSAAGWTIQKGTLTGQGLSIELDPAGRHVYLLARSFSQLVMYAYDATTLDLLAGVVLPGDPGSSVYPHTMERVGDQLVVVHPDDPGRLWRVAMAGASTELLEATSFENEGTRSVAISARHGRIVLPTSLQDDGLRIVDFGGEWSSYCGPAVSNSSGQGGRISASGSLLAGAQPFRLDAAQLPREKFGLFLVADQAGFSQPAGSQGNLCLGGTVGRFTDEVASTGGGGRFGLDVDLTALPTRPPRAVQPGETWYFQAWFRDENPSATSNFTDGAQVRFR